MITGRDSAAERDVLVTARRRWPAIRFEMYNCAVQGPQAAANVIEGLRRLDADPAVEVIVIARGGGSVEDLLPFSDEGLVRAIAGDPHARGHRRRATRPTRPWSTTSPTSAPPPPPTPRTGSCPRSASSDGWSTGCGPAPGTCSPAALEQQERWLESMRTRPVLASPDRLLHGREEDVLALRTRARRTLVHRVEGAERDLEHARARVAALSPAATLERGYAVVQRADGSLVRDPAEVADGELPARPGRRRPAARARRPHRRPGPDRPEGRARMSSSENAEPTTTYEQAREELADVVRRLEAGGLTLEESLALWERGEELAKLCQHWLDRARERLAAAAPADDAGRD